MRSLRKAALAAATLVLALSSCAVGVNDPLSPDELSALRKAQALWQRSNVSNYVVTQRQLCFCPPGLGDWTIVTVRGGQVVSATNESGNPVNAAGRVTVEQAFQIALNNASSSHLQDVRVQFDVTYGYPTLIEITAKSNVADGGLTFQAKNLQPLP